jgi:hypothetical protein
MIAAEMMDSQPHGLTSERPVLSRVALTSFALALGVSLALLFVPTGTQVTCLASVTGESAGVPALPPGACRPSVSHPSLLDVEGPRVVIPLSVPVLIAGLGLGLGRSRFRRMAAMAAGWLLFGFVVVGAFSIGLFYLPSAVAMFLAGKPVKRVPVPA